MTEIYYQSACEQIQAIRNKQVSCKELVIAHLDRIQKVNSRLNAVVTLDAEHALDAAIEADRAIARGKDLGRLYGVPMTIKDSIDTKELVSTWGTIGRKHFKPKADATVVKRVKHAGAIILGKTNTPELTLGIQMTNDVCGPTFNPYDPTKSPGGSSGGAAAILAAGGAALELGSDTGGSIREPANYCGLCGIKPTFGRVPRTGHAGPWELDIWDQLTQIGPMARTVDDLELLLSIVHGEDAVDPYAVTRPLANSGDTRLEDLRVAFYTEAGVLQPIVQIRQAVLEAAKVLQQKCGAVKEDYPLVLQKTSDLYIRYTHSYLEMFLEKTLGHCGTKEPAPNLKGLLDLVKRSSQNSSNEVLLEHNDFRAQMGAFMQDYDIIICPASVSTAAAHCDQATEYDHKTWFNLYAYNLTGWPAAVIPAGITDEGLPYGIQMVGKPWREDVVLAVARFLEQHFGGFSPPEL